jgi:hypothetical protein
MILVASLVRILVVCVVCTRLVACCCCARPRSRSNGHIQEVTATTKKMTILDLEPSSPGVLDFENPI